MDESLKNTFLKNNFIKINASLVSESEINWAWISPRFSKTNLSNGLITLRSIFMLKKKSVEYGGFVDFKNIKKSQFYITLLIDCRTQMHLVGFDKGFKIFIGIFIFTRAIRKWPTIKLNAIGDVAPSNLAWKRDGFDTVFQARPISFLRLPNQLRVVSLK